MTSKHTTHFRLSKQTFTTMMSAYQ